MLSPKDNKEPPPKRVFDEILGVIVGSKVNQSISVRFYFCLVKGAEMEMVLSSYLPKWLLLCFSHKKKWFLGHLLIQFSGIYGFCHVTF